MKRHRNALSLCAVALLAWWLAACTGGSVPAALTEEMPDTTSTAAPDSTATPTRTPAPSSDLAATALPEPVEQSALERIRERGEIVVGVLYNYPPLSYLAEDGTVRGFEPDLMRQIAERWGVDIRFVQVTRQTRLPMLEDGAVDVLAAAMPRRRDLDAMVEYSDTTFRGGFVVAAAEGFEGDVAAALNGGAIGVVGSEAEQAVDAAIDALGISPSVTGYDAGDEAIAALAAGEVNAVVGRREHLMLPAESAEGVALLDDYLLEEPYAFAVRRGDTPLRDLLNLTLQQIIAAGEIGTTFSANFYGMPSDVYPAYEGEATVDFASMPADLSAGELTVARLQRGEPLRVAGFGPAREGEPFDGQAIYDAYNQAVVTEMANRWGVEVEELTSSTGADGLAMLEAGEADMLVGVRPDLSLFGHAALSGAYYTRALRMIHLDDVSVLNILDLNAKPVLIIDPIQASRAIVEDNNQVPHIEESESAEDAFDSLMARGVYAVVGDEITLMLMAESEPTIEVDEDRYRPVNQMMAVSRFDDDMLALVNYTLQDMIVDGMIDALRDEYFEPYLLEGEELEPLNVSTWPGEYDVLAAEGGG